MSIIPVSYTHLDVYKRQASYSGSFFITSKPASEIVTDIDSPALVGCIDVYKRQVCASFFE